MMGRVHGAGSVQLADLFAGEKTPSDIMASYDTNGDSVLDLSEFEVWDTQARKSQIVDRFQAIDANGVDAISIDELASAQKMDEMGNMMDGGMSGEIMQNGMDDDKVK